ncbi:CASP-like protein 1 [Salvia miltiorrhiza]|uniref:CASP-like protein 1 n=1 Tax=Salvia miltiorrhiza TaxID=226208 RepID=UPI0025AD22E3|nr:CASP-like protein 1 [Salvia miltiorrhiza]
MASVETPPVPEPEPVVETPVPEPEPEEAPPTEVEKAVEEPPPEVKTPAAPLDYLALAEVVLRFLLFASALVAVVVIVTSKQTKNSRDAKFNYSPALIYFVAALSVAGLYSFITTLLSFYALLKPGCCPQLLSHFVIVDVILLGIVAAATGSAGSIAYTGLKGNSHLGWGKVCDVYDKFCTYVGASVAVSLFASVVLALLVLLSLHSLSKKVPK